MNGTHSASSREPSLPTDSSPLVSDICELCSCQHDPAAPCRSLMWWRARNSVSPLGMNWIVILTGRGGVSVVSSPRHPHWKGLSSSLEGEESVLCPHPVVQSSPLLPVGPDPGMALVWGQACVLGQASWVLGIRMGASGGTRALVSLYLRTDGLWMPFWLPLILQGWSWG